MSLAASPFAGQRVLITGAGGFLGSRLCRRLRGCGAELHAVSRTRRAAEEDGLRWWPGDLSDSAFANGMVADVRPDLVFHLAGEVTGARDRGHVLSTLRSNLLSTVHLLDALAERGGGRLVLAGSMEEPRREDDEPVPCSPYAASKWAASGYARMFHALYGLETVVLRIFMVYGPGQRDTLKLVPSVILSLLRGEAPRVTRGTRPVDWVFVEDVVDALLRAAAATGVAGASFDIGSGTAVSIREIVERLAQLVDPLIVPAFGAIADRPLETVRLADAARTERGLGWTARTPLAEGLKRTVEWYVEEGRRCGPPTAGPSPAQPDKGAGLDRAPGATFEVE